jgi:hypothetical protein
MKLLLDQSLAVCYKKKIKENLFEFLYLFILLDLAIDDLSTRSGICQTTTLPQNIYKCLDGTLIPLSKVRFT